MTQQMRKLEHLDLTHMKEMKDRDDQHERFVKEFDQLREKYFQQQLHVQELGITGYLEEMLKSKQTEIMKKDKEKSNLYQEFVSNLLNSENEKEEEEEEERRKKEIKRMKEKKRKQKEGNIIRETKENDNLLYRPLRVYKYHPQPGLCYHPSKVKVIKIPEKDIQEKMGRKKKKKKKKKNPA
eukprot:TRINITY_DN30415_c0_g1_i1.p1 TRINITY_DN30415_c0_g1~~TRINITY_DN30415_c0_g1_i1.p1  ORF type:complete len:182 (-),score=65.28 TRINITY_DN30415_c0_g1_i1:86-631(-)